MFTRKDYLSGKCTSSEYYSQYVEHTNARGLVLTFWDEKTLSEAYQKGEHLNSLSIKRWDELAERLTIGPGLTFSKLGDMNTLSNRVCVLKETARQIVKEYQQKMTVVD